jgi:hypothetical protein
VWICFVRNKILFLVSFQARKDCTVINFAVGNNQIQKTLWKIAKEEEHPRFFVDLNSFQEEKKLKQIESQVFCFF